MKMPARKNIRLKNFDYSLAGNYFITICIYQNKQILSKIIQKDNIGIFNKSFAVELSSIGKIINKNLLEIENIFNFTKLNEYIIMPNYLHFILSLMENGKVKLGSIIGVFKSLCVKDCISKGIKLRKLWQRNFYEHIIRNEKEYKIISDYIIS
ncbi:MAG: transposase, partial [candidate division WOR-3 bacterium]